MKIHVIGMKASPKHGQVKSKLSGRMPQEVLIRRTRFSEVQFVDILNHADAGIKGLHQFSDGLVAFDRVSLNGTLRRKYFDVEIFESLSEARVGSNIGDDDIIRRGRKLHS